jgi:hypothetical protein
VARGATRIGAPPARATEAARNQPEEAEIAGEAIGETREWRRGPIRRRSSTQKSKTPTATRAGTVCGGLAAVPMAEKSRTTTESPPERHMDGEEAPKPVDLQPKKRMNKNSHTQRHGGNQRDIDIGKDRSKPERSRARRKTQPLRTTPNKRKPQN